MNRGKTYLIDLEGTILQAGTLLPGAANFLREMNHRQASYLILCSRSGYRREQLSEQMKEFGLSVPPERFYTGTMAAVDYIVRLYPQKKKAAYLGGRAMQQALQIGGFTLSSEHPDWLFIALDRNASYQDYSYALQQVCRGAVMVSTDSQQRYQSEKGIMLGNGAIVAMLEYASGSEAVKIGLPSVNMISCALRYLGTGSEQTILVGSSMERDIACGMQAGLETVLVMTEEKDLAKCLKSSVKPTYLVENLAGLLR